MQVCATRDDDLLSAKHVFVLRVRKKNVFMKKKTKFDEKGTDITLNMPISRKIAKINNQTRTVELKKSNFSQFDEKSHINDSLFFWTVISRNFCCQCIFQSPNDYQSCLRIFIKLFPAFLPQNMFLALNDLRKQSVYQIFNLLMHV